MSRARASGPLALLFALAKAPEVFLTLFVFAGIYKTSPYLALPGRLDWTAIMGGLALGTFLLRVLVVGKGVKLRFSRTDAYLLLLSLQVLVGLSYSLNLRYGLSLAVEFVLLGVFASYFFPRILAFFAPIQDVIRNVQRTLVAIAIATAALTLAEFGTAERAFAGSYLSWGYFLGVAIILAVVLRQMAGRWMRLVYSMAIPFLLVSLAMSQARGPVIGLAVILAVIIFKKGIFPRRARLWLGVALLVMVTAMPFVLPSDTFWRISLLLQQDMGASVAARMDGWTVAARLYLKHPVLGIGTGSFRIFHETYGPPKVLSYPHNLFLGVAAETGTIGLVLVIGFLVSLFRCWRKSRCSWASRNDRLLLAACLFVVGFFLIGDLFSGHLPSRQELLFAGLTVAFAQQIDARGDPRMLTGTVAS